MSEGSFHSLKDRWFVRLGWMRRIRTWPLWLVETFTAERLQIGLWFPPALGLGAAGYFGLSEEPPLWLPLGLLAGLGLAGAALVRRGGYAGVVLLWLATVAAGMTAATVRTMLVSGPIIDHPLGPVWVTGTVLAVEPDGARVRLLLGSLCLGRPCFSDSPARRSAIPLPQRLRVTVPLDSLKNVTAAGETGPSIGRVVRVVAKLMPAPMPAAPGPFDFQRDAWFQRIGGVGFGYGPVIGVSPPEVSPNGWRLWLQGVRVKVATRLETGVGGAEGAVAAALATGLRAEVPLSVINAYRDSGLSHLLAIAGLHLGLAAGVVFLTVRGGLALWPWVALRVDIKKVAAVIALLATAGYLVLSGARIPTERAFMTGGIVLLGIVLDRSALSLRGLGVAAVVILLIEPEAIVGPSFQMSFSAVTGLIVTWSSLSGPLHHLRRGSRGVWSAMGRATAVYLLATLASTTIAGLATAPYTAYHFHRVAVYGSVGNLIAIPLASVWIMPWLVLALVLMPFGWDGVAFWPLKIGLQAVEMAAREVSSWPGAALMVPPVPTSVIVIISLAGLWLAIWRRPWRHWAWPVIAVCAASPWLLPTPHMVVSGDGRLLAARGDHGMIYSSGKSQAFVRETWQQLWGNDAARAKESSADGTEEQSAKPSALQCDKAGCVYETRSGYRLAVVREISAIPLACRTAAAVINTTPLILDPYACAAPWVINRDALEQSGAIMLTVDGAGHVTASSIADARGHRPWMGSTRQ